MLGSGQKLDFFDKKVNRRAFRDQWISGEAGSIGRLSI
jgi:hypothetical protein